MFDRKTGDYYFKAATANFSFFGSSFCSAINHASLLRTMCGGLGCYNEESEHTARMVACHFININHTNKLVSVLFMDEKSSRPEENGNQWLSGLPWLGESRHHTLLPWEHRANSSATV